MTTVINTLPKARRGDPLTSHIAARRVRKLSETKSAIMVLLREKPISDEMLVLKFQEGIRVSQLPFASPSGIRSRRHELAEDGYLVKLPERHLLMSGNYGDVWAVTK